MRGRIVAGQEERTVVNLTIDKIVSDGCNCRRMNLKYRKRQEVRMVRRCVDHADVSSFPNFCLSRMKKLKEVSEAVGTETVLEKVHPKQQSRLRYEKILSTSNGRFYKEK